MFSYCFDLQRVSTADVIFSQFSEDDVHFQCCAVFWQLLALGLKRKIELARQHECREM
jgi:hypothetical protein